MPRRSGEQCRCHGSIARRVDALSGAVETQKTPGCLQCYCFMFMQRLHQFATLTEIAEKVAEGLVNADELQEKEFLREICCQSSHAQGSWKEQNSVEEQFPCLHVTFPVKTNATTQPQAAVHSKLSWGTPCSTLSVVVSSTFIAGWYTPIPSGRTV